MCIIVQVFSIATVLLNEILAFFFFLAQSLLTYPHLLLIQEQEEAQDEETVESSIASDILFEPKQETSKGIDIFQCLNDICDGQWGDMFLQVVGEEADRAQRAASPETAVVLYQPRQIVPYHNTDILPYTPPGPLVLYEPPRSLVLYDYVETEKKVIG